MYDLLCILGEWCEGIRVPKKAKWSLCKRLDSVIEEYRGVHEPHDKAKEDEREDKDVSR
jgi:hypothetical protein